MSFGVLCVHRPLSIVGVLFYIAILILISGTFGVLGTHRASIVIVSSYTDSARIMTLQRTMYTEYAKDITNRDRYYET